jgi:ketosteroid isomerase-like protein
MSQENFEALRAEYAAMSRRNWNAVLSVAHRDFELKVPGGGLDLETIRGVESARRAFEDFFSPFEELTSRSFPGERRPSKPPASRSR